MPAKVQIEALEGPSAVKGKTFVFDEHDTLLFGRMSDCHICLPGDDKVSRHHFILEVNPPEARIRDLGSLNGTYVNNRKIGARGDGETPEQAAQRHFPEIDLKDGDRIKAGQIVLAIKMHIPATCCQCGNEISADQIRACAWISGTFLCSPCRSKLNSLKPAQPPQRPCCRKCGKDFAGEIGGARPADYVCAACRQKQGEQDPLEILQSMLAEGVRAGPGEPSGIAGYEITKKLGVGGFGAVYLARNKRTG